MIHSMIGRALLGASVLVGVAAPADADERLVEHVYREMEVIRVEGSFRVQATIIFGEGETIENVAVGDSQSWQITPNKRANVLFVKPLAPTARTNMTVITDQHRYFFDLVASNATKPLYMLRFAYNESPARAGTRGLQAERNRGVSSDGSGALIASLANSATIASTDSAVDPAKLNFDWKSSGDSRLVPQRIYDDGSATFLLWRENQPVPVILITNDKGEEGPVNYAVRGNMIVINDVPSALILRNGRARAILRNEKRGRASNAELRGGSPRPSALVVTIAASPPASTLSSPGMVGR